MIELSAEQIEFDKERRAVYNSGHVREAFNMAKSRFENHPDDLYYKFNYAVMAGDLAETETMPAEERDQLHALAKMFLKEVFDDPKRDQYPEKVVHRIRNEYYYFNQLHAEQYKLGEEALAKGEERGGYYSMCVGASEEANRFMLDGKTNEARAWAEKSLASFRAFEKLDPLWYNINAFAARSAAILGQDVEAERIFQDQYRKQGKPVDEAAIAKFRDEMRSLTSRRSDQGGSETRG